MRSSFFNRHFKRTSLYGFWAAGIVVSLMFWEVSASRASNEMVTIPVVLADYYGWAYTEAFEDHAYLFGWSMAAVDGLGWSLFFAAKDYDAGLFLVNAAGIGKTLYPIVTLLDSSQQQIRNRAWIALGTHSLTLCILECLGRPALSIQTSLGPRQNGLGVAYAFGF